jgi:hypothetical protein
MGNLRLTGKCFVYRIGPWLRPSGRTYRTGGTGVTGTRRRRSLRIF